MELFLTVEGNNVCDVPLALREFLQGFQSDFLCGFCSDKLSPYHKSAVPEEKDRQSHLHACRSL